MLDVNNQNENLNQNRTRVVYSPIVEKTPSSKVNAELSEQPPQQNQVSLNSQEQKALNNVTYKKPTIPTKQEEKLEIIEPEYSTFDHFLYGAMGLDDPINTGDEEESIIYDVAYTTGQVVKVAGTIAAISVLI